MKTHKVYFYTCDYYDTFDVDGLASSLVAALNKRGYQAEIIPNICESPDSSRTIKIYNL
jgi:hypothetical protein